MATSPNATSPSKVLAYEDMTPFPSDFNRSAGAKRAKLAAIGEEKLRLIRHELQKESKRDKIVASWHTLSLLTQCDGDLGMDALNTLLMSMDLSPLLEDHLAAYFSLARDMVLLLLSSQQTLTSWKVKLLLVLKMSLARLLHFGYTGAFIAFDPDHVASFVDKLKELMVFAPAWRQDIVLTYLLDYSQAVAHEIMLQAQTPTSILPPRVQAAHDVVEVLWRRGGKGIAEDTFTLLLDPCTEGNWVHAAYVLDVVAVYAKVDEAFLLQLQHEVRARCIGGGADWHVAAAFALTLLWISMRSRMTPVVHAAVNGTEGYSLAEILETAGNIETRAMAVACLHAVRGCLKDAVYGPLRTAITAFVLAVQDADPVENELGYEGAVRIAAHDADSLIDMYTCIASLRQPDTPMLPDLCARDLVEQHTKPSEPRTLKREEAKISLRHIFPVSKPLEQIPRRLANPSSSPSRPDFLQKATADLQALLVDQVERQRIETKVNNERIETILAQERQAKVQQVK